MNYSAFINKEVVNKNNQKGITISFNEEHVVVKYDSEEKTYNPDVAFKNGFLSFINSDLNKTFTEELTNKEKENELIEQQGRDNDAIAIQRNKVINEMYKKLDAKNRMMQALFGGDFKYPPYIEFYKIYKNIIKRVHWYTGTTWYQYLD